MKLPLQVSYSPVVPSVAKPLSSDSPACDRADQCGHREGEMENRLEHIASSSLMNVIVKEEEEEEPLCGTSTEDFFFFFKRLFDVSVDYMFTLVQFYFLLFSTVDEAHDLISGSEDCTIPERLEEADKQQQEGNTDMGITVKEEEEEPVSSK